MTYTINGIGTSLVGARRLTKDELTKWKPYLPKTISVKIKKGESSFDKTFDRKDFGLAPKEPTDDLVFYEVPEDAYYICAEAFVIIGLPLVPLKIPILVFMKEKTYIEVYHPFGGNIDWNFIGSLWQFKFTGLAVLTLLVSTFVLNYNFWEVLVWIWVVWFAIIVLFLLFNFISGVIGWVHEKVYGKK